MLEMRPCCEGCGRNLPPDADALICSFECTFCPECAAATLKFDCPNCGGELVARPRRAKELWAKHPPSTKRIVKSEGCQE